MFHLIVSFCAFIALWHAEVEEAESLQGHINPSHHIQSILLTYLRIVFFTSDKELLKYIKDSYNNVVLII